MFQFQNVWLPDGEKHFPEWMAKNGEIVDGRGTYQIRKWRACLPWIKQWRTAVDVGAHVGLWTMQMAARFEKVQCFEPIAQFRECWVKNVNGGHVMMRPMALGDKDGWVEMKYDPADSGGTHVFREWATIEQAAASVAMTRLDALDLQDVDFVKVDAEGYEHNIIAGARETLTRCKPCVIVEQKQHKMAQNYGTSGTPAVELLLAMGAKQRAVLSGDHIVSWD